MSELLDYCNSKAKELLGIDWNGYDYGFHRINYGGLVRKALYPEYLKVIKIPERYLPTDKREESVRIALKGIDEKILEHYKRNNYYVKSSKSASNIIKEVVNKALINPKHTEAIERRDNLKVELDEKWKRSRELILKVHTDCICGVIENPISAFRDLIETDWLSI